MLHLEPIRRQPLAEARGHLCGEGLHGGHVHDLELVLLDDAILAVLLDGLCTTQHGYVGLSGAGGGADQQVLVSVQGRLAHHALNLVEGLDALEGELAQLVKVRDRPQLRAGLLGAGTLLLGRYRHLAKVDKLLED